VVARRPSSNRGAAEHERAGARGRQSGTAGVPALQQGDRIRDVCALERGDDRVGLLAGERRHDHQLRRLPRYRRERNREAVVGADACARRHHHHVVENRIVAGELVGGLERVEHRGQAGIEHVIEYEHRDPHWRERYHTCRSRHYRRMPSRPRLRCVTTRQETSS